jgi:cell division cycle protein 20 (cofactor of APC complex)
MTLPSEEDYICSVSWIQHGGSQVAIGTAENMIQLWDAESGKLLRTMKGHNSRVGSLAWNNHILTSGSRDTQILNHDVRIQNHIVGTIQQHSQEVCGLSWSPDGMYLASGANDNTLRIFDIASSMSSNVQPIHTFTEHQVDY